MQEQNFKNHSQFVPSYHYVLFTLVLVILVLSIVNLVSAFSVVGSLIPALIFVFTAVSLAFIFLLFRAFALKAQDRAIRAEENLRHFALTGKLLDSSLKVQQIVALRFASDDEFVALAARAAKENLSNKDIKAAIKTWRGDYYRV
jgi:Family of unknown function (DUF6526)